LAASVAGLLAVGSTVWFVGSGSTDAPRAVLAQADVSSAGLDSTADVSGTASVVDQDGARVLELSTALPEAGEGEVFEVWLFDDGGDVQSLGLTDGVSQHVIPAGVDLDRFTVVDVSREEFGGDPAHSKDSVARGALV
jgi:anti-sigma-K factor RskA